MAESPLRLEDLEVFYEYEDGTVLDLGPAQSFLTTAEAAEIDAAPEQAGG